MDGQLSLLSPGQCITAGPSIRKSRREWGIAICHPGGWCDSVKVSKCSPTVETVDWRCNCWLNFHGSATEFANENCQCVGDLMYRGACLHCDWKGTAWDEENLATGETHDHCWPGWRELPIVGRAPERGDSKSAQADIAKWLTQMVAAGYSKGWLLNGGPIRTRRQRTGRRSHSRGTPFGGYDLCGEVCGEEKINKATASRRECCSEQVGLPAVVLRMLLVA